MRITPLDVRKQEFRRSVRGFDCDEVRAFMATLADEYEIVLVDNKQIREKLMHQEEKISEYKTMERTLRDTLMTAEKLMAETRDNANKEGELIVQDAKLKAKQILQECRLRTEELRREIQGLRKEKENYLGRFKSLAESQIQFIESHRTDFKDLDDRLTGIVDSVVQGMATTTLDAEKEEVVETIVEAMIQPEIQEMTKKTEPVVSETPVSGPEVDVWRSYNPATARAGQGATTGTGYTEVPQTTTPDNSGQDDDWKPSGEQQDQPEHREEVQNHNESQPEGQNSADSSTPQNEDTKEWESTNGESDPGHQETGQEDAVTETLNI